MPLFCKKLKFEQKKERTKKQKNAAVQTKTATIEFRNGLVRTKDLFRARTKFRTNLNKRLA